MAVFDKEQKKNFICILISGLIICLIILFKIYSRLNIDEQPTYLRLLIYLIPYIIVGHQVILSSISNLSKGKIFDENFLMTIASIGAFVVGEYTEAVAVMLLYQIGELFQDYAVNKSRRSIKELMEIAPASAVREGKDGKYEVIDPSDVKIDDILIIKPGEKVPVDGVIINGEGEVNTSALTGESIPKYLKEGDEILSGYVNGEKLLKIKANKLYDDSTVAIILELVEESLDKKSKSEKFITKFSRYYTPVVVISAILLFIIPSILTMNWREWLVRACTFLVISCPCALVISVPLAFFGGVGAASRAGILVKGSNYLEALSKVKTIITDKTGTLTTGEFKVSNVYLTSSYSEEYVLKIAASLESYSTHPIAKSICDAYDELYGESRNNKFNKEKKNNLLEINEVKNISGLGITGNLDGKIIAAGNYRLMNEYKVDIKADINSNEYSFEDTSVYVTKDNKLIGIISISDKEKLGAKDTLRMLKSDGIERIVMLTGDKKVVAEKIANNLGISEYYSELLPQDKVKIVEDLMEENKDDKNNLYAYIGDGINDAPVLSRVDVGIAMGGAGSDAAIEAADIVIMDDELNRIEQAIRISKRTTFISWQNIIFALSIKVIFLILGAFGIIGMWWAVFADVGVAIICILNSMRMLKNNQLIKKLDFSKNM